MQHNLALFGELRWRFDSVPRELWPLLLDMIEVDDLRTDSCLFSTSSDVFVLSGQMFDLSHLTFTYSFVASFIFHVFLMNEFNE